jgi:predicted O-methyltransferase YrrM
MPLPDTIDLLLLDGAKTLYPEVLELVESCLKIGAFTVADNADYIPSIWAACARPQAAACRYRSPRTSSCRCASAEPAPDRRP